MHTFDLKTGFSCFEFGASPHEPVYLVGDFNGWKSRILPMQFVQTRWVLRVRLAQGSYKYAFQVRDGFYGEGVAEVPFCCWPMTKDWLCRAGGICTCGRHFWKWN